MRLRPRRPTTLSKASSPGRLAALFCSVLCLFVCFLFYLLSKILELNGLTECSLDEATAQATLLDLLEKFEKKYGHSRVEREHKNKLLHRCFYKMEADNTEKDSATDRTKQTQSGSVDGSQLGSLMDAFSGSSTAIEVNVTAGLQQECRDPQAAEGQDREAPRGGRGDLQHPFEFLGEDVLGDL